MTHRHKTESAAPITIPSQQATGTVEQPASIYESAKMELEHRINLYKFLLDLCVKGILFFLAVLGVSVKLVWDDNGFYGRVIAILGACATAIMLVPIIVAILQAREWREDFIRLGQATHTKPVDMKPLWALIIGSSLFWFVFMAFWIAMYFRRPSQGLFL